MLLLKIDRVEEVMRANLSRYLAVGVVLLATLSACGKSSPTAPPPAPCTYTLSSRRYRSPRPAGRTRSP